MVGCVLRPIDSEVIEREYKCAGKFYQIYQFFSF